MSKSAKKENIITARVPDYHLVEIKTMAEIKLEEHEKTLEELKEEIAKIKAIIERLEFNLHMVGVKDEPQVGK